mmetsp:Transcript_2941/g.6894  ORF Transcript_2941/g.6894 Transcript_2941/m.6894 type:complete len:159 (+) Transcript_2941:196-672(+)
MTQPGRVLLGVTSGLNALYAVEPVLRESIDQSVILAPGSEIKITRLAGLKNGANSALRVRTSGKSLARTEAWKRGGTLISATREQQLHDVKLESSAEQWFPRSTFSSCIQVDEWETTEWGGFFALQRGAPLLKTKHRSGNLNCGGSYIVTFDPILVDG